MTVLNDMCMSMEEVEIDKDAMWSLPIQVIDHSAETPTSFARSSSCSAFSNAALSLSERFVFLRPLSTRDWYFSKSS